MSNVFLTKFDVIAADENDLELTTVDLHETVVKCNSAFGKQNVFSTIYSFGEEAGTFRSKKKTQNYSELLKHHIENELLFEDPNFQPDNILLPKFDFHDKVEWKRPYEIVTNPKFIADGLSRFDIEQGGLGDCWFLAAVANLTLREQLLEHIVPIDQSFIDNYAGIFHFRFWRYGRWVDVVIDDRLPTVNGKLIYLSSDDPKEFWTSLLEKAYAKLYGSYKNIEGGQISEALEDMTGGLSELYETNHSHLHNIMSMSYQRSSFMGCSILSAELEGQRNDGLVTMHAYSITKMVSLNVNDQATTLIRLRNPWGNEVEWQGAWSDQSEHWYLIPKETRDQLHRTGDDGEFWMDLNDFQKTFTFVDICHLDPSTLAFLNATGEQWCVSMFEGAWVANVTAGGGIDYIDTFANNPQYFITVKGADSSKKYDVVIGLMQKNRRLLGVQNLPTQMFLYRVPKTQSVENTQVLKRDFFETNKPLSFIEYNGSRQLTGRFQLPPGRYCIIPCTPFPNLSGEYLLRVFSEVESTMIENDDQVGYQAMDDEPQQQALDRVNTTYQRVFKKIAQDGEAIGWNKIRKVLNKVYSKPAMLCFLKPTRTFSKETCRNIVSLWDSNHSGTLEYDEFWKLMTDVTTLEILFKKFDQDNSGKLSGFELRNLLESSGYKVNRSILSVIMLRYGVNGCLTFENFVICAIKLRAMIDEFNKKTSNEEMNLTRNEWLEKTLYV